jgi:hypothetical protein
MELQRALDPSLSALDSNVAASASSSSESPSSLFSLLALKQATSSSSSSSSAGDSKEEATTFDERNDEADDNLFNAFAATLFRAVDQFASTSSSSSFTPISAIPAGRTLSSWESSSSAYAESEDQYSKQLPEEPSPEDALILQSLGQALQSEREAKQEAQLENKRLNCVIQQVDSED